MNFLKFKDKIENFPYFETRDLKLILGDKFNKTTIINLGNWVEKGYLIMIRRGLYILSDFGKQIDPMFLASKIYPPSYVSMEKALNSYGIIPEAVFTITSVSTRKTKKFKTTLGHFSYQKIKKEAFGGYETRKKQGISYKLALPEKALVDFFYLNRNILDGSYEQFKEYRFDEDFKFSKNKLLKFAKQFDNKKLEFLINNFIKYYVAK
jgi:predicted transcriptional regulator of viral defense system